MELRIEEMNVGSLYRVCGEGPSLYRDQEDIANYYWQGLTPNHSNGALEKGTVLMYLGEFISDGAGSLAVVLHDGREYLIFPFELEKIQ